MQMNSHFNINQIKTFSKRDSCVNPPFIAPAVSLTYKLHEKRKTSWKTKIYLFLYVQNMSSDFLYEYFAVVCGLFLNPPYFISEICNIIGCIIPIFEVKRCVYLEILTFNQATQFLRLQFPLIVIQKF